MIGNDVVALIKNYKTLIIKSRTSNSDEFERFYLELILASLPMCLFTNLYPIFKDEKIGRKLLRIYLEEFSHLVKTEEIGNTSQQMVKDVKGQTNNETVKQFPVFYSKNIGRVLGQEESLLVKNFSNAILNQYIAYSKAAITHGFL